MIPEHIAIIMDGNGRWAKQNSKSRKYGHREGANTLENITKYADSLGIKHMTVYAFSTENWNRPKDEVEALMDLLRAYLKKNIKDAKKNNFKIKVIGDIIGLPNDIQDMIEKLRNLTQNKTGINLNIALNYGGRDEIIRATKKICKDIKNNRLDIESIDEDMYSNYLDTRGIKNPDLLIRTSGEIRLSNFLLWQIAYTEMYFIDKYWPDFRNEDLDEAIRTFNNRNRRYGK